MNEITNQPTERNNATSDTGAMRGASGEHTGFWSNISSEIWSGVESLTGQKSSPASAPLDGGMALQDNGNDSASAHLPGLDLSDYKDEALKVYDQLDSTNQGFVTKEQLAQAVDNPQFKGEDAEALAALYVVKQDQHAGNVPQGLNPDVLTRAEIEAMPTSLAPSAAQAAGDDTIFQVKEAKIINRTLLHADASLANAQSDSTLSNPAFTGSDKPSDSVKADDIKQGHAGDCYFDSALAAVAASNPETISNSIAQNENGSYTVTFKGDPSHPMTVPPPTDSELALYNGASKDGIWPSIMEKAFADHQILFGHKSENNDTAQDASSNGRPAQAMYLLTGDESHFEGFHEGQAYEGLDNHHGGIDHPMQDLENSVAQGDIAVVGTGNQNLGFGLADDHAYTVVGYQPGQDGGTFELRNPWGDDSRPNGDYFSISGDELAASIHDVSYSDTNAGAN